MRVERIEKAIYSGETLRVRYFGGSTPGLERQIRPIAVSGDGVQARCLQTGETKTFKLVKLEEVRDGVPSELAKTFVPPPPQPPEFDTVKALAQFCSAEVESLGWCMQLEGDRLTLHRRFKSGKPMKGSDVSIAYESTTYDLVFDGENTVETNHRLRERPWIVAANKQTTKTFSNAARAGGQFMAFARQLAPNSRNDA